MKKFSLRYLAIFAAATFPTACADRQSALTPTALPAARAVTGTERVLYSFSGGSDGGDPATALVFDTAGNLYGTTVVGGSSACGTIFRLSPESGSSWQEHVLYSFGCYADGKNPYGGVTLDRHGNLFGTTVSGGSGGSCASSGCGVVFQLKSNVLSVLHSFTGGDDGFGPGDAVALDREGHLFGMTPDGGRYAKGTVYEVWRSRQRWRERVIHAFSGGKDGAVGSLGALLIESTKLYGVTEEGGAHGAGIVYELSHPTRDHEWKRNTLYGFKGQPDAASPYGGLVADSSGNLYGTTYYGGANGLGAVFEILAKKPGRVRERVLYSFKGGDDGSAPTSTLLLLGSTIYGTTSAGGSCACGTVFALDAKSGKEHVVHAFAGGMDGAYPYYGLAAEGGNLFGTTVAGGTQNQGTIFEVTP